jgi:hypothetical protein
MWLIDLNALAMQCQQQRCLSMGSTTFVHSIQLLYTTTHICLACRQHTVLAAVQGVLESALKQR